MDRESIMPEGLTPREAVALQQSLRARVQIEPLPAPCDGLLIAGADCSYSRRSPLGHAAIVVCSWPSLELVEIGSAAAKISFPYVPGLLSFRELPLLDLAWQSLRQKPDLVFVDGQGLAHPRRFGIASHAGFLWDCPTIGSAKSLLVGEHETLGAERGSTATLLHKGDQVGIALRTRAKVKPVYLSVGYRCDLPSAVEWALRVAKPFRLPEVIRVAHREVNRLRVSAE